MRAWTRWLAASLTTIAALVVLATGPVGPTVVGAATCSDYSTQASAQAAADTRDADGDGTYCESLPCPCSTGTAAPPPATPTPAPAPTPTPTPAPTPDPAPTEDPEPKRSPADPATCTRVSETVKVGLSKTKYPAVRQHWDAAIRKGYPRVLTIHRAGAERRRSKLLAGIRTKKGYDRDEYPMAMARSKVEADVELVPSKQNRGAGSVQGTKLRRYCSGQRFQIVWY